MKNPLVEAKCFYVRKKIKYKSALISLVVIAANSDSPKYAIYHVELEITVELERIEIKMRRKTGNEMGNSREISDG